VTNVFDARTEGARERALMAAVRSGALSAVELEAAVPAFPIKLQIQTLSPCNASCAMCPWPDTRDRLPQGRMDEALFGLLVDQIADQPVDRVGLFLMNEPLLDQRLARWTALLKRRAPHVNASIFTNGTGLDGARARALAEAGMDEVNVSVVGFDAEHYGRIMQGLDFETLVEHLVEIAALRRAGALGSMQVRVVGLAFPEAEAGIEAFRARVDLELFLRAVTNRAGSVDVERFDPGRRLGAFRACQRPFVKAYVLYNGDMVLCNCDWERSVVLGNARATPLAELWRGARLAEIRAWHLAGELPAGSLCASCDYTRIDDA